MQVPTLYAAFCDDAAIFPPGLKPLADAVPDHLGHRRSDHRALVGPLVVSAAVLDELADLTRHGYADGSVPLSVTVPSPDQVNAVAERVLDIPPAALTALEVVVVGADVDATMAALPGQLDGMSVVHVYLEVPRDESRPAWIGALRGTPYRAKFRTGGVRADLYPVEDELADCIEAVVAAGVPFKATAGLHHALRNTDDRGFEQHGFCNLLWATERALAGDGPGVRRALAERDAGTVAAALQAFDVETARRVREAFVSFGTCSIDEPRDELVALGLVED
ncbi:hypothetical protein GCM10027418_30070 [Mariniluteicoccus endophyticus]